MNYEEILKEFLKEVQEEGTYATREKLEKVVRPMLKIVQENPDPTAPEEWVEAVIQDDIQFLEEKRSNYPIPGYTVGIQSGNINVKMFGGNMDATERKMREDALFDIASTSKFYTQIIAYNLMKEGAFTLDDKVKDLDPRFKNVGDLTMRDVLTFTARFRTDGRLDSQRTIEEAKNCLYTMNVEEVGKYHYNDLGMMLTKEVMEQITGKTYQELVDYYIVDKLGLKDTHLVLPKNKIERFTGSANDAVGMVNDGSALAVGGYSGHAGIKVTSDDLISLGKGVLDGTIFPSDKLSDTYTQGARYNRGIMGNTYISHENGTDDTYVSVVAPKKAFAVQGSTRNNVVIGPNSINTILLNPCSMGLERAREEEAKQQAIDIEKKKNPSSLIKNLTFERDGQEVHYTVIDARPRVKIESFIDRVAETDLRLRFLNHVMNAYEPNYRKSVNVVANGNQYQKK